LRSIQRVEKANEAQDQEITSELNDLQAIRSKLSGDIEAIRAFDATIE
jgi:hypothetical protein